MTSAKVLRGLRGATTATANTSEAILEATEELLRALQDANGFEPGDVESAIFTSSPDLTAEYPRAPPAASAGPKSRCWAPPKSPCPPACRAAFACCCTSTRPRLSAHSNICI